ncbi:MAG TPA: serine/threonine-protein kinase [Pirellulaceae bacterium]|nr:serine/threonine protein kinase [Planctomycetales bacterium]MCB9940056.1 serine/threonine protein kinase [Planctomycetaceae bacterium]HRX77581.1 serine/threonine-protein kinase [Pirellulaceae bacterium]
MPLTADQFVVRLRDSGLLSDTDVQSFRSTLNVTSSPTPDELAEKLIQEKKLTEYQAKTLCLDDSNPLVIGEYVVLEEIGRGGMGRVYKAFHRRMERTVAIKTMQSFSDTGRAIERFRREVRAAAKLIHPNIVTALDAGERDGTPYLVMEYVEGENLCQTAKRYGGLPVDKALNYLLQAARGLDYAHRQGIIHRDIKPSNMLLCRDGMVKVLDLGLARFETGSLDESDITQPPDLTRSGDLIGTTNYVSPEAAVDIRKADFRADIYSLGCTLYFLLTARSMYIEGDVLDRLFAHRNTPAPSLCDAKPFAPALLDKIFQKMVAKDPGDRYQSMAELIAVLERSIPELEQIAQRLIDEPTATMPISKSPKRAKKSPARVIGLVALLLLGFGGWWLFGIMFRLDTPAGTLMVDVNEPGATVTLLDEDGSVEIKRKADDTRLTVAVDLGRKELRVEKDGFQFYTTNVTVSGTEDDRIHVELVPLKEVAKPQTLIAEVAASKPQESQRELATWILTRGGAINILTPGGSSAASARKGQAFQASVNRVADLPKGDYRVWRVAFPQRSDFDDDDLAELAELCTAAGSVGNLNLSGTAITSEGLKHFKAFEETLVDLDLHDTSAVTDDSIPHLSRCRELSTLLLIAPNAGMADPAGHVSMSLEGIQQLKKTLPACNIVWHPDRAVGLVLAVGGSVALKSDQGVRFASKVSELPQTDFSIVGVNLGNTSVRVQLRDLRTLSELESLNLSGTPTQDVNLVLLKQWPLLKDLDLSATEITDDALPTLKTLTNLRSMRLANTRISERSLAELRSVLKACQIETVATD